MVRFFLFQLTLLFSLYCYGQKPCNIVDHYGDFIKIEKVSYENQDYLIKKLVPADSKKCYAKVISNSAYIDYLLTNFSNQDEEELVKIYDCVKLQKAYIEALKRDTAFNAVMRELVEKTVEKSKAKDTVSMNQLLNIAVKYFSILKLDDHGNYVGKVCVGLNDIKKTEKNRKAQIEAFCFSSIVKNYEGKEYNMYNEFVKSIRELYSVNLGVENDEKLFRAQGAMYFLMKNNETLKKMLKAEYEMGKENLPFILLN